MKIALFGGTFDPPHVAHVHMILTVLEKQLVDEVWVVPVFQNPLKHVVPTSPEIRRQMVHAAFAHLPLTKVVYDELDIDRPSFTIDTVRALQTRLKKSDRLFFIIGSDAFSLKQTWKEIDALEKEIVFLVVPRGNQEMKSHDPSALVVDMPTIDVSSTDIRERVQNKKYVSHLIHPEVEKLIQKYEVYKL